ncbi:hypothetical protein [Marimonas arenosa]|uniref:Uncharacterized protein n=1 Tax=Marimonas arenosa TaxID=1795305 RepID=A0AAE4B5Y6_9RHOB|nr:hypothetical protein [Marimonas arenosa]MDQ2091657.1 hypothetical protein [Marimonas arenosa]
MTSLFTYDQGAHFISCLELADQNLRRKYKDEANVRWIVISLHDALYTLLIQKLTRTDGFGIYNDKFEKRVGEFYEKQLSSKSAEFHQLMEQAQNENIASIVELLKRANLASKAQIRTRNIEDLPRPSRGLSRLKSIRNFFSHPAPMLAGYYSDWLLDAISDTVSVIDEVRNLPGKTAARHDTHEADLLLKFIAFYLFRWRSDAEQ